MTAMQLRYSNLNCPECDGKMIHNGPYVSCTECGHQEGRVTHADRQRKNAGALGTSPATRIKRSGTTIKARRAREALARIGQQDFSGRVVQPGTGYRATEQRVKASLPDTATPTHVQITSKSRHAPCDRLYVVVDGRVVCPACGTVDATNQAIQQLLEAFNPSDDAA